MVHVPYKGGAPALTDTLGGQVEMYAASPSEVLGIVATKQLRLLAISDDHRIAQLPDVPAIAETYPGFRALTWNGLLGPAHMPASIVVQLADQVRGALADAAFVDRLVAAAVEPAPTRPDQFTAEIRDEYALWRDVITRAGLLVR
jgi:tripartite-type tricarboxylate transporter receptor subunit TctC